MIEKTTKLKRWPRMIKWMAIAGVLTGFFHSLAENYLDTLAGNKEPLLPLIFRSVIIAALIGLSIGFVEVQLDPFFRNKPFYFILAARSVVYTLIISLWLTLGNGIRSSLLWGISFFEGVSWYVSGEAYLENLTVVFILMMFLVGVFQINTLHRKGELINFILGKYHQPREEQRFFCFIDLKDSTAIAEKLGNLQFGNFLKDYYSDITEAIRRTDAEIYQYIGDEIVLSWPYQEGRKDLRVIQCFFLMEECIEAAREKYLRKYNSYPRFKAGLHGGNCLITWVGELKKDIVYVGDVLNTASRIQGECNRLGKQFLASGEVLNMLGLEQTDQVKFVEEFVPRGKTEKVKLYSLDTFRNSMMR